MGRPSGRAPGKFLPQPYVVMKHRDVMLSQPQRGQIKVQVWPPKRGKPKSATTRQQNAEFVNYVKAQRDMWVVEQAGARAIAWESGYTWRDVLSRALVGRLIVWGPNVADDIQTLLDGISSEIGAMLLRTSAGWVGLSPGSHGDTLTIDTITGLPTWEPGAGGGGGLFVNSLSPVPSMASTGLGTWVNQGSATSADGANGLTIDTPNTGGGGSLAMLTKAAPATPYAMTALLTITSNLQNFVSVGLGWYDGANKVHALSLVYSSGLIAAVQRWNSPTSFNANDIASNPGMPSMLWVRLSDDGTNVSFEISVDGDTFVPLYTVAKSAGWLGAAGYSNLCFFANGQNAEVVAALLSYED